MSPILVLPAPLKNFLRPYWLALNQFANWLKLQSKIFYVKFKRLFVLVPIPEEAEGRLNLHLGCGRIDHKEFINVDGYPFPHVHYVQKIDRLPQFKSDSVDLIYASHCLEHFRYLDIDRVLCEWLRVLKPGGILRLSVPDFDKLVAIYNNTGNPDDIVEQVMGGQNNRYNFHYVLFNKNNLTNKLILAGCTDVKEWIPGDSNLTTFADFSVWQKEVAGNKYPISLNIEARKV